MPVQLLKKSGNTCPLPYPEKFKAAVKLVKDRESEGRPLFPVLMRHSNDAVMSEQQNP